MFQVPGFKAIETDIMTVSIKITFMSISSLPKLDDTRPLVDGRISVILFLEGWRKLFLRKIHTYYCVHMMYVVSTTIQNDDRAVEVSTAALDTI